MNEEGEKLDRNLLRRPKGPKRRKGGGVRHRDNESSSAHVPVLWRLQEKIWCIRVPVQDSAGAHPDQEIAQNRGRDTGPPLELLHRDQEEMLPPPLEHDPLPDTEYTSAVRKVKADRDHFAATIAFLLSKNLLRKEYRFAH